MLTQTASLSLPKRCINIDWLEVCAYANTDFPMLPEVLESMGYSVKRRDYGTPIYNLMFTVNGVWEVRSDPKSKKSKGGLFRDNMCHIRLTNVACYYPDPIGLMNNFLSEFKMSFRAISRIDICNDFVTFDNRVTPANFIKRYLADEYAKINQINVKLHLKDKWSGKECNYLAWGSPKSMVSTKLYDKTLELDEQSEKPYIKAMWKECGLPTDKNDLHVYRLEFSVRTDCKRWTPLYGGNGKIDMAIENNLQTYSKPDYVVSIWQSLMAHYFKFVHRERTKTGTLKRKYDCQKIELFKRGEVLYFLPGENKPIFHHSRNLQAAINKLEEYKRQESNPNMMFSLDTVLEKLYDEQREEEVQNRRIARGYYN